MCPNHIKTALDIKTEDTKTKDTKTEVMIPNHQPYSVQIPYFFSIYFFLFFYE